MRPKTLGLGGLKKKLITISQVAQDYFRVHWMVLDGFGCFWIEVVEPRIKKSGNVYPM